MEYIFQFKVVSAPNVHCVIVLYKIKGGWPPLLKQFNEIYLLGNSIILMLGINGGYCNSSFPANGKKKHDIHTCKGQNLGNYSLKEHGVTMVIILISKIVIFDKIMSEYQTCQGMQNINFEVVNRKKWKITMTFDNGYINQLKIMDEAMYHVFKITQT